MTTITIPVAEEVKRAFESAQPETQQQLSSLVTLFFQYNLANKCYNIAVNNNLVNLLT
jgi:hypothetical protein